MFKIIQYFIVILIIILLSIPSYAKDRDFHIFVHNEAQFIVTDPLGRKTGFDPTTNTRYKESKNQYYAETGGGEYSGEHAMWYANIRSDAIDGVYKIKVVAADSGFYSITIDYPQPLNMQNLAISTFSYPGKVDYYEFNYNYTQGLAGVPLTFVRVITPSTLLEDINAITKLNGIGLNYIGNTKFVSEIIKEINEIESEKAKGKVDDGLTPAQKAKKEYTELLKEITEKYNKPEGDEFVKQEAYSVLKEDIEYIITHL